MDEPYYRQDLAMVHHLGFGFRADDCAPGILDLLRPVLDRAGLVVELGCGTGLLTRYLVDAGHRVIATDASPAMLEIARTYAARAADVRPLTLPDDPIPNADAIVSVGHVLSYLPDADAVDRALVAAAAALNPGGVLAVDLCDLTWGSERRDWYTRGWIADDWGLVTEVSLPEPDRFVRQMAVFTRNDDGSWRRDDERHDNVLVDTSRVPGLLEAYGAARGCSLHSERRIQSWVSTRSWGRGSTEPSTAPEVDRVG
ncbi:MAG TPA: class I SAM-dependent methyltransferase [Actinomycetota bacterium]|nr:class I SAM-dependent methyltransferase [Actinomycetota bacterium]